MFDSSLKLLRMKNYFIGIDASKGYADFSILNQSKVAILKSFKLLDTAADHERLVQLISNELSEEARHVFCGIESTGGYEDNWYRTLSTLNNGKVKIVRINPLRIHHQSKANLDRTITDAVASNTIALHLSEHHKELFQYAQPDVHMKNARKVYKLILTLNKQKTQLSNQLEKVVYSNVPELVPYLRNGFPKWLLMLLNTFPGKDSLSRAKVAAIAKIKGISSEKAEKIQRKIKSGIGAQSDLYITHTIKSLTSKIIALQNHIIEEKKFLEGNFNDQRMSLLESIKGIGTYTAAGILIEVEDINRFKKASSLSSYFGVHPEFKKSGDGGGKAKMSKKGRSSYRSLLFMAARNVVNHNPYFKTIYANQRAKGMNDTAAIGVIMHKLTKTVFGILKSNQSFDPKVDQENQKRNIEKLPSQDIENLIENQKEELELAIDAPVSGRKVKNIKKELSASILTMEKRTKSDALSSSKHIKNVLK